MNDPQLEPAELARAKLRAAIAEVALHVADLSTQASGGSCATAAGSVALSWHELLPLIQLEPEPERRPCPHCHRLMMRAATRCKYCLEKSEPPSAEH